MEITPTPIEILKQLYDATKTEFLSTQKEVELCFEEWKQSGLLVSSTWDPSKLGDYRVSSFRVLVLIEQINRLNMELQAIPFFMAVISEKTTFLEAIEAIKLVVNNLDGQYLYYENELKQANPLSTENYERLHEFNKTVAFLQEKRLIGRYCIAALQQAIEKYQ